MEQAITTIAILFQHSWWQLVRVERLGKMFCDMWRRNSESCKNLHQSSTGSWREGLHRGGSIFPRMQRRPLPRYVNTTSYTYIIKKGVMLLNYVLNISVQTSQTIFCLTECNACHTMFLLLSDWHCFYIVRSIYNQSLHVSYLFRTNC